MQPTKHLATALALTLAISGCGGGSGGAQESATDDGMMTGGPDVVQPDPDREEPMRPQDVLLNADTMQMTNVRSRYRMAIGISFHDCLSAPDCTPVENIEATVCTGVRCSNRRAIQPCLHRTW